VVEKRLQLHARGEWRAVAAFLGDFQEDQAAQALIGGCLAEERAIPQPAKQLADILLSLRNQAISRQVNDLLRRLGNPELSDEGRLDLLRQQQTLLLLKRQPLQFK
jgi:hypothetical protein